MDPNMTLHELHELCGEVQTIRFEIGRGGLAFTAQQARQLRMGALAVEIEERFDALDQWMTKGGFAPDAWKEMENHL